ncbi:hypothetical protein [Cellulophaga fucicola]|uniref:hypothetical protein n=1 Tax=Cellulophaga fucicola TaxID=76595 RepID=UPI003EC098BD
MSVNPKGKTTAIVSYLTGVGTLIAITMNMDDKHEFARFHIRQNFGLNLFFLGFALFISQWLNIYASMGLYISYIVLWTYGFIGMLNNKKQEIPFIGKASQKWFTFIN